VGILIIAIVDAKSSFAKLNVFYPFRFKLPLTWVNLLILFFPDAHAVRWRQTNHKRWPANTP
jgi:hypothetical protein